MIKPFPKSVGWIGGLGGLLSGIAIGLKTGDWSSLIPAVGAVMALLSHSATGTGGAPE